MIENWSLLMLCIRFPNIKNKEALKVACINRCKKEIKKIPKLIDKKINLNWLRVDKAINFFRSDSKKEIKPEKKIVQILNKKIKKRNELLKIWSFIKKIKIPAVTNVEE